MVSPLLSLSPENLLRGGSCCVIQAPVGSTSLGTFNVAGRVAKPQVGAT